MNELEHNFVSTWALRDDFTADAQRVSALPSGHTTVAKNFVDAFEFPVTCVVCLKHMVLRRQKYFCDSLGTGPN
jgi:hypothetical protein